LSDAHFEAGGLGVVELEVAVLSEEELMDVTTLAN
jgi:hypothetical protein